MKRLLAILLLAASAFGQVKTTGKVSNHGKRGGQTLLPVASLSTTSLTFPTASVGVPSDPQLVSLTNTGTASMTLTSVAVSGTNAADFAATNSCGSTLVVGGFCNVSIIFTPSNTGTRTATLSFADNARGSPQTVSMVGSTTNPIVSLNPSNVDFGTVDLSVGSSQTVVLTNTGGGDLTMTSVAVSGTNASDFSESTLCTGTIAATNTCDTVVTFKPTNIGTRTANLVFTDDASDSPQTVTLTGNGNGPNWLVTFTPTTLAFGNQQQSTSSQAQDVTLTNSGAPSTINISSIAVSTGYSKTTTCGSTLAAGASCTISITFTPTIVGTQNGTLTVTDDGPGSPQTLTMTGAGTSASATIFSWSDQATLASFSHADSAVTVSTAAPLFDSHTHKFQVEYRICGIPSEPALSYSAGGSLPQTTYYVRITSLDGVGESTGSKEVSLLVPANNVLVVTLPGAQPTGITGINVYVSSSAGTETKQNGGTPVAQEGVWTEPVSGLVAGAALPSSVTLTACGAASQDTNKWASVVFTQTNVVYIAADVYIPSPLSGDANADWSQYVQRKIFWLSDSTSPTSNINNYEIVLSSFQVSPGGVYSPNSVQPSIIAAAITGSACNAPGGGTFYPSVTWSKDAWHRLQLGVQLNDVGVANGTLTLWIDGVQVYTTGPTVNIRRNCTTAISFADFGEQANRYNYLALHEFRYFDNMAVSSGYIP